MTKHSSIVGGSTAARVLACPGSVVANLTLPPQIRETSEYAEEGTFFHAVMAHLMETRQDSGDIIDIIELAIGCIGEKFHDRLLTEQHLYEGIFPALDALETLEAAYGNDFEVVAVERSVKFPGLQDTFGTIDLMLRNSLIMLHVDFKFGQGVPVSARYIDGVNPQLMFYTAAARASLRALYGSRSDVVAIIQPRGDVKLDHTVVDQTELHHFKAKLKRAVNIALSPGAPRAKGEHCRWAPCKTTCPLWTGPLLEAAAFGIARQDSMSVDEYALHLAKAKALVDLVAVLRTEVDNQLHTYLSNGGTVPGWRLKAKQKNRQWIDEDTVERELKKLGFKADEIWQKKLLTFAAADSLAKRKNKEIPEHLRVAPATSETTIAADNDPAPVVQPIQIIEQFRASLRALIGPT